MPISDRERQLRDELTRRDPFEPTYREALEFKEQLAKSVCFIDGCRKLVSLVVATYPDWTFLCKEHRHLYNDEENIGRVINEVIYDDA